MHLQGAQKSQTLLKKEKNNVVGLILPDLKTYHRSIVNLKSIVNKAMSYGHKKDTVKQNKI